MLSFTMRKLSYLFVCKEFYLPDSKRKEILFAGEFTWHMCVLRSIDIALLFFFGDKQTERLFAMIALEK